jgi:hypothetical protein
MFRLEPPISPIIKNYIADKNDRPMTWRNDKMKENVSVFRTVKIIISLCALLCSENLFKQIKSLCFDWRKKMSTKIRFVSKRLNHGTSVSVQASMKFIYDRKTFVRSSKLFFVKIWQILRSLILVHGLTNGWTWSPDKMF